ncbi:MAG: hypothetical protein RIQ89_2212 [Bacteroidota bacterium]|jgi:GMP synthase (glutamine-hydrolysing)
MQQTILIVDFGSQVTQLIARRIRELNVYCEIHPFYNLPALGNHIKGVILSGSPASVREPNAPSVDLNLFINKYPILGICYGAQFIAQSLGGEVKPSNIREYGRTKLVLKDEENLILKDIDTTSHVWMSHSDTIQKLPDGAICVASTDEVANAAFCLVKKNIYAIQFHPEVTHTDQGLKFIENFVLAICKITPDWSPGNFIDEAVNGLREKIGKEIVILGLSGGVDSSVAALLLHKAIGAQLHCIFVDNGLLRQNEFEEVLEAYKAIGLNIKGVNAANWFYDALRGLTDPEAKRKAIGKTFIDVFERESKTITGAKWLAQGTIYPDVIESVSVNGPSATIKSHHNVGGLPEKMNLKVVEPLRLLFKDEVRRIGKALALKETILNRHPFPGPGLGIRILGEITEPKVKLLQQADHVFITELKAANHYNKVWQAGAILLPINTVGVMGDERTYEQAIALRAVTSIDGMTADWAQLPYELMAKISNEIINKVKGINRVVYDISSKPPATIEWE